MTTSDSLREEVRRKYADAALAVTEGSGWGCGSGACCEPTERADFGESLYTIEQRGELPDAAALASLGCGNPTAIAELQEGETVLDLGSGGGIDESLQMMGDGRLREIQRLDQVACADRLAGRRNQVDDAHARRIGECSEERRARLCLLVGEGWSPERGAAVDNR